MFAVLTREWSDVDNGYAREVVDKDGILTGAWLTRDRSTGQWMLSTYAAGKTKVGRRSLSDKCAKEKAELILTKFLCYEL